MEISKLDAIWSHLVDLAAEATRMTDAECQRLRSNPVAKLVGLLPFIAGCDDADRTALAHLATWIVANRGAARAVFDHRPSDDRDPLARLAAIADFRGGDRGLIEAGLRRLALCMVAGYARDQAADGVFGEYNPLASGAWKPDEMQRNLGSSASASAEIDAILDSLSATVTLWGI